MTQPGQEIQMSPADGLGVVQRGRAVPADIPDIGEYLCLQDIVLSGNTEAFKAKKFERVLLKKEQALDLMLQRKIIPTDTTRWRPYDLRLSKPGEEQAKWRKVDDLDKAAFDAKLFEIGIRPGQKKKKT